MLSDVHDNDFTGSAATSDRVPSDSPLKTHQFTSLRSHGIESVCQDSDPSQTPSDHLKQPTTKSQTLTENGCQNSDSSQTAPVSLEELAAENPERFENRDQDNNPNQPSPASTEAQILSDDGYHNGNSGQKSPACHEQSSTESRILSGYGCQDNDSSQAGPINLEKPAAEYQERFENRDQDNNPNQPSPASTEAQILSDDGYHNGNSGQKSPACHEQSSTESRILSGYGYQDNDSSQTDPINLEKPAAEYQERLENRDQDNNPNQPSPASTEAQILSDDGYHNGNSGQKSPACHEQSSTESRILSGYGCQDNDSSQTDPINLEKPAAEYQERLENRDQDNNPNQPSPASTEAQILSDDGYHNGNSGQKSPACHEQFSAMAPKEFDLTKTSEEEVNILVLGETQSGKSTFIEAVRSYADPTHNTDNSTIGTGVHSHTNDVLQYKLHSNLPQYKAFPSRSGIRNTLLKLLKDEDPINYRQALCESALEDFEDILYDRKATLSRETFISESQKYKFNICDTPGLNDSDFQDEIHVANILRRVKKLGKIHQVLVMIPPVVFTPGFISAIKTYVELLPEFCDIMAFVHTRISYTSLHPENDGHISTLSARVKLLGEIIGRDSAPHFLIDSQLDLLRPVQKCITMNTIRDVLWTARFNQPVSFLASLISKTKKMRDVDSVVCDNVSRAVKSIEKTMLSLNAAEGRELGGVLNARLYIQHLSLARQKIRYELELLESNDFCLTSETLWNQWWETPQWRGTMETKINEADQTVLLYQQSAQQLTFTNRMMRMENGDMISLTQHHEAKNGHGFRHIRLYKRRRELHKDRVIMLKRSQEDTEAHLRKAEHWCNDQSNCRVGTAPSAAMQLSLMKYSKCISLVDRLSLQYLSLTDFRRLAVSRAYMGDLVECACLVEEYYQRQYETVKTPVAFGPVPMQANTSIQGLGSSQNGRSGPDKQARTYRDRVSEIGKNTLSVSGVFMKKIMQRDTPKADRSDSEWIKPK